MQTIARSQTNSTAMPFRKSGFLASRRGSLKIVRRCKAGNGVPESSNLEGTAERARRAASSLGRAQGVSAEEFQAAVLLVFALYASMALLNAGPAWSTLVQDWQGFVEFLANGFFR